MAGMIIDTIAFASGAVAMCADNQNTIVIMGTFTAYSLVRMLFIYCGTKMEELN